MADIIENLQLQDTADRQKSLNKETSFAVLSLNDALPIYVNHDLFDNFMENSLKCQDAIIEKFYKHLQNKGEQLSNRVQDSNNLNENLINAILELTKSSNIKQFSYLISLLNNINDFLLGNKNEFGFTTTKFLKNNIDYNLLRRFITQDQEEESENFAKYVYKHLFGFNLDRNEADFYLDSKNDNFLEINNTTALSTLINLVNVYFSSGLIHARTHSRQKYLLTETRNPRNLTSIAKNFYRDSIYANLYFDYSFLVENKINEREFSNYFRNTNITRNNNNIFYLSSNKSFNDPSSVYFVTKNNSSNFNVFENIGNFNNNNDYIRFDDENESLLAASRTKELINLDVAFENINLEYQNLIKPLISANVNAALASEWNLNERNISLDRSITRSSYYIANKYLYDINNSEPTAFIENVKFNIGQAKSIYTKLINDQNPNEVLDSFYKKTEIVSSGLIKELKSAVVLSNSMPDSLLSRESSNEEDKLFSDNLDYFESNNKISSLEKGFNKLSLLNVESLDNVINLHQAQKEKLEEKINALFKDNKISSCNFYEKILEKSVEGIRNSLERIQLEDQPHTEYYPAHLLEEISLLIRFNSNKNSSGKNLCKLDATRRNIIKLLFAAAKNNTKIDVLDDFTSDVVERNLRQIKNTEGYGSGKFHAKGTNVSKFINNKSTVYLGFNQAGEAEGDTASIADNAIRSIGISSLSNFVKDMCFYEGSSEVDFSKIPIDYNKKYTLADDTKILALRYHQSLGHIFSSFYTSSCTSFSTKDRDRWKAGKPVNEKYDLLNKRGEFFYVPFFGFLRGEYNEYPDQNLNGFFSAENPFDIYTLQSSSIFSQMRSSSPRQGIFNSFINLLKDLFSNLDAQSLEYNKNIEFMIFNLFKAYSQTVIMQLSNLFEYSSLLHIPKMVSEPPLHYSYGLFNKDKNFRAEILNNLWSDYEEKRKYLDGVNSRNGGDKGKNYRYPKDNSKDYPTQNLIYCNVKSDFQPSQSNIERYLSAFGISGYYTSNQTYNDRRLEFNNFYQEFNKINSPLTFGLFCKRVNVNVNTKEASIDGGLDGEIANGNKWFESLKQEANSYKLLGSGTNSFWGNTYYPYNYPLLSSHNHLLSFYNGFIGTTIDRLLSQLKENYLVNKTEIFERDAIYGPLSKIHNAFLAEDLSFTFLLDSVRYGFNHFKEYKKFLESLEEDSVDLQEKRQLIEENISKFYDSEEGFSLDEYLSSISKSQKLSIINKFRVDNIERNTYYNDLINNRKPSINSNKIIENYKQIKNELRKGKYDKILVVGVGESLLERSTESVYINVYMKDFVYKKRNLFPQEFKLNVGDFGRVKIINAEKYRDAVSSNSSGNIYNILSEQCRDYLAIATGNSISDSDLFKSNNLSLFDKYEGSHFGQETFNLLSQNLPEINSFYEELNNFKNDITVPEDDFFFIQDNFNYSNETDLYLYEKSSKDKIKKDIVKRMALFDYMIFSNDATGRRCLLREFPRIFYIPINTKDFYSNSDKQNLKLKNLSDISVEVTLESQR